MVNAVRSSLVMNEGSRTLNGVSIGAATGGDLERSMNNLRSDSRVCASMNFFIGSTARSRAVSNGILPSTYGLRATCCTSVKVGPITKKVMNNARPTITWFGGVCGVPRACRSRPRTITILVKAVIERTIAGSSERNVIKPSACRVRL